MKKILIATKNPGKLREIAAAMADLPWEFITLNDIPPLPEPEENGETFAANALVKASYYKAQTGLNVLADDSGLEVKVLGGAPGVRSARFAGYHASDETNNAKLLQELAKAKAAESPAAYRCVIVLILAEEIITAEGSCEGTIKTIPRGEGGFGYDPYFYLTSGQTMAQLSLEDKEKVSHRGKALRKLTELLKEKTMIKNG